MKRVPVVVLASGRGSNFEAVARAIDEGVLRSAQIAAVLSDRAEAPVLEKAKRLGIPALHVPLPATQTGEKKKQLRERHDRAMLDAIRPFAPRFLVLAGYMRMMSPLLLEAFKSERGYHRIVNIHPSLLPSFPGIHSYAQAFRHGVHVAGVTVHLVNHEMDSGPICAQKAFAIDQCETADEVEKLGLAVEHELYPRTLQWVLTEDFDLKEREGGRLFVCPRGSGR